jgi:UDP-N-acetylmuramoyl-L-alanyl-D-glutamate--2,6-diaminopimelate ligase
VTDERRIKPIKALIDATDAIRVSGDDTVAVSGIAYNSKDVQPGDLFVALRGGYTDGHFYIDNALANGAVAVLTEEEISQDIPYIVTRNSRAALADVSARFFDYPSRELNVIGITGTDGKTSTSLLAEAMLARSGKRTGLIGTVSIKIGDETVDHETRQTTPESLEIQRMLRRMVDEGVESVVLEATSHGLDLHRLDHVEFNIGAVTNITHEHLEHHGTIAAYWRAKAQLFERIVRTSGQAIVNADDEGAMSVLPYCGGLTITRFGVERNDVELAAHDISLSIHGSRFRLAAPACSEIVESPLLGMFNIANGLCAAGIAMAAGVDGDAIIDALEHPPVVAGRMASIDEGQPFNVIVDYAHTPASLEKVLTLLRSLDREGGRLIVVSGSAGERDVAKRAIQGSVCAQFADVSVFSNEDPRNEPADEIIAQIAAGAKQEGAIEGEDFFQIIERKEAVFHAISMALPGDTVLLAGKGHERSIIWNGVKHPWDEAAVAREALAAIGFRKGHQR